MHAGSCWQPGAAKAAVEERKPECHEKKLNRHLGRSREERKRKKAAWVTIFFFHALSDPHQNPSSLVS